MPASAVTRLSHPVGPGTGSDRRCPRHIQSMHVGARRSLSEILVRRPHAPSESLGRHALEADGRNW